MPQQVQGVVARSKGAPVELAEINIPDPDPNDVVVRIQACGVCHTDLTYRDGGINDNFPFLLGHEAAGIVESAGTAVTHVERRRLRRAQVEEAFATMHRGEVLRSVVVL